MADYDTVNDMLDRLHEGLADSQQQYFSPSEEIAALNEGVMQIYQIVDAENKGFFFGTTPETITLNSADNFYALVNEFGSVEEILPSALQNRYKIFERRSRTTPEFRGLFAQRQDTTYADEDRFLFDVVNDKTLVIVPRVQGTMDVDVYTIREPASMVAGAGTPPLKKAFRPLVVEYAVAKLKGKEETGEYTSHQGLFKFMLENLSKYCSPRAHTNHNSATADTEYN